LKSNTSTLPSPLKSATLFAVVLPQLTIKVLKSRTSIFPSLLASTFWAAALKVVAVVVILPPPLGLAPPLLVVPPLVLLVLPLLDEPGMVKLSGVEAPLLNIAVSFALMPST